VNRHGLVKTIDQPSFSSVNFMPVTSAEALRASGISAVPGLNLQSNTRGGIVKKITSSFYRNFIGATQKKKIKQATKSKTNRLAKYKIYNYQSKNNKNLLYYVVQYVSQLHVSALFFRPSSGCVH